MSSRVDLSAYKVANLETSDPNKFDNLVDAVAAGINGIDANGNLAIATLADPGAGKLVGSSGGAAAAVFPPGYQLNRKTITSNVSVTATAEGTADTVIASDSVTFDGLAIEIEFYSPGATGGAGGSMTLVLLRDSTVVGQVQVFVSASRNVPVQVRAQDTPAAGAHTYTVKAFVASGTGTIGANAGGSGLLLPAFLKITKA